MELSVIDNGKELKQELLHLEKLLLEKAIELARRTYKAILEEIDALIKRLRVKTLSIEHKRSTWYRTRLGIVKVTRRQYRDEKGYYHYLLDELLGMEKYRHTTMAVQDIALDLASSMTFRGSSEVLRKTSAIDLSHQTIHRLLSRIADTCLEKQAKATEWFLETGELPPSEGKKVARLMVEADGVMISLQREKAKKAEVKVGIAYEGWQKVGKDRYRTVNKTSVADIADSDTYWSTVALKLHQKYDLCNIKDVIVGGDGAGWIKEGVDYFGGRFQLCRYHLNRELCYALGHDRERIRAIQESCNKGKIDTALKQLEEAANRATGDKARGIRSASRYVLSNASGLQDYRQDMGDAKGLRRAGAIEGNVDKLVVRRMKNQGMSWTLQGVRRMLWLRINSREGTLTNQLYGKSKKSGIPGIPLKRINRVVDKAIKRKYFECFNAGLPALYGPHASRPWVKLLKSLTEVYA